MLSQYDHSAYKKKAIINKEHIIKIVHNTNACSYLHPKM